MDRQIEVKKDYITDRWAERQTNKRVDRRFKRSADGQMHKQTNRRNDRHMDRPTDEEQTNRIIEG